MTKNNTEGNKLFHVIIEDRSEWDNPRYWIMAFLMPTELKDPEKALRAAINDFCKSPEGRKVIDNAGGNYNWGDVLTSLPAEYVIRHGMIPCTKGSIDIVVDHDETLISE